MSKTVARILFFVFMFVAFSCGFVFAKIEDGKIILPERAKEPSCICNEKVIKKAHLMGLNHSYAIGWYIRHTKDEFEINRLNKMLEWHRVHDKLRF